LSDLWWLPQLQLGIAVLTNSSEHDLQGTLALGILRDLVTEPDSRPHHRMLGLPTQSDVVEPDDQYVAPPNLADRIAAVALPASSQQSARWAGYPEWYRTGQLGAMNPASPPPRFHVESGVPYFDASEDGTPVRHRLSEFQPGLFLAENGETLDLRGPSQRWRGVGLNPVTNGPLAGQWALPAVVVVVAAGWLVAGCAASLRPRRRSGRSSTVGAPTCGRIGRRLTTAIAAAAALAALVSVSTIRAVPGLVDVGFLGWMAFPLPVRLAFHLPLAVALLAAALAALLVAGALRHWWTPRIRPRDAALAVALTALAAQLASWHLVAWGSDRDAAPSMTRVRQAPDGAAPRSRCLAPPTTLSPAHARWVGAIPDVRSSARSGHATSSLQRATRRNDASCGMRRPVLRDSDRGVCRRCRWGVASCRARRGRPEEADQPCARC
jgi:hypothetical protein